MHGYSIPAADALDFALRLRRLAAANMLADIEAVSDARRPLLTYAALVLEYVIRVAKPKTIVFSTFGVREGAVLRDAAAIRKGQGRTDLRGANAQRPAVAIGADMPRN